jgi:transcriptional regulator GlxA family with amidase domain
MSPLRARNSSAATYETHPASNGVTSAPVNGTNGKNVKHEPGRATGFPLIAIPSSQEHRIRKILKLIESEPARSIHELAAQFKLSQSHLQHLFKQQTGVQLGHLLMESRLRRAAHLLENSTMSVKEIAYAVGYEHTSSFTRAFERRFALAPRSYRRQSDRGEC